MQDARKTSPAPVAEDYYTSRRALSLLFMGPKPLDVTDARLKALVQYLMTSDDSLNALSELRGVPAELAMRSLQSWMDRYPEHPERYKILRTIVKIAVALRELPNYLYVRGLEMTNQQRQHPIGSGGYGDIYRAEFEGKPVAIKQLVKYHFKTGEEVIKQVCREAVSWRQLNHPNVLQFIGVTEEAFRNSELPCLVAPLMDSGNLLDYARNPKLSDKSRTRLLLECITGLEYIHAQHLIHGDVRAENVLINRDGRAVLADFGLVGISDAIGTKLVTHTNHAGCLKFMAPELIRPDNTRTPRTPETDAYSFGSVCLQVYTGSPQHPDAMDSTAVLLIQSGTMTSRPKSFTGPVMPEIWWEVVQRCLSPQARHRPSMGKILDAMSILGFKSETRTSRASRRLAIARIDELDRHFQLRVTQSYTPSQEETNGLAVSEGDVVNVVRFNTKTYKVVDQYGNEGRVPFDCCAQPFPAKAIDSFDRSSSKFNPDSDHIPLKEGEVVQVLRVWEKWWMIRTADGKAGSVPANKLKFTPDCSMRLRAKARAMFSFTPPEGSAHLHSFSKEDEFSIEGPAGSWLLARRSAGGPLGLVPAAFIDYIYIH